tara:strand:+ start:1566 stop:1766 length:201 start_codon:yes stop_codon:yes gene_type:complete
VVALIYFDPSTLRPFDRLRTGRLRAGRLRTGRLRTGRLRTGKLRTGRLSIGKFQSRCALLKFNRTA